MSTQRIDLGERQGRFDPASVVPGPLNGLGSNAAERLPRPPGRRRPGLAVLAVLLIVLGAAVAGLLAVRFDQRVPVLIARHDIAIGSRIGRDDLAVARIAQAGIAVIPADRAGDVIGRYASTQIARGRLIDQAMLGSSGLLTSGKAAVGIALQPGRYPASGLASGDVVQVIRSVDGVGKVLAVRAVIGSVQTPADNVFSSSGSDTVVVTAVVDSSDAPSVAAAAAADQVSLVLLSRGASLGAG